MCHLISLDGLKFLLNVAETHVTDIPSLEVSLAPNSILVCALLPSVNFGVVVKVFAC